MFTGSVVDLRTIWAKHTADSPLPADEFRGIIKGQRATAIVDFSGNAKPNGFWVRVVGTQMCVETNLFEPPRLTLRRFRAGEPALMSLLDGIVEARDVFTGTVAGFWRKLAGTSSYDGLPELIARVYGSLKMLMANSSAILTDAFPSGERGLALGLNQVAGIAGSFIGLVLGGVLGPLSWRYVFLVSVPFGVIGTVWSYLKLQERGIRRPAKLDWWGNVTFAAGLIAVLVGITYGIQPYGGHTMGWTSPLVIILIAGGLAVLTVFCVIETRVAEPMFRLDLFKIRPFTAGNLASLLAGLGRGGMMFILIIWLQGI